MHHQFVHPKKLSKLQEYFSKSLAFPTQISYNRTAQKNIFFRTTHKAKQEKQTASWSAFWSFTNIPIYFILPKDTSERRAFLFVCYMEKYGSQIPWMGVNVL